MRKKSLIALFLLLAMAFGMTGCGSEPSVQAAAATPEVDEYVYASEFKTLSNNSKTYLNPKIYTDDGFYATTYEKIGENVPEGAVPEYEDQYAVWGSKLYFVGYDGTVQELTGYKGIDLPKDEEKKDYNVYNDLSCIAMTDDGKLLTIENISETWYDGPEDVIRDSDRYYEHVESSNSYFIRTLDESGIELSRAEISNPDGAYMYPYWMAVDSKGNIVFPGDNSIMVVNFNGEIVKKIELESYVDTVFKLADGKIALTTWIDGSSQMAVLDSETYTVGDFIKLPDGAYNPQSGRGEYYIYYNDGSNMYGLKEGASEPEKLFNWLSCDINGSDSNSFRVNDDGSFITIINRYNQLDETYNVEYAKISKVPASSLPKKEILTLGAPNGVDWDVRDTIISFNRKSHDCRIEVLDYSEYNTESDYNASVTKLTTELLAGKVPDILDLSNLPYTQLASKGILEDLYPYIQSDEELSKAKFFENVFKALEVNGKLYSTCANFSVQSIVGAASVVGDTPGWTYDDYYAALESMPEGCDGFDVSVTRDDILRSCLALDLNNYMDWSTGKCSFDSDSFQQLLKFTASFPESFDWENYEWTEENNFDTRIAEGRQMLMSAGIYSMSDIRYFDFYFGGDATYIGYPTLNGTGNILNTGSRYAMSAAGQHKDQVWQFLRQFYTEENQAKAWGLPTNRAAFDKLAEKEMRPEYKKDADGKYILDKDGNKIEASRGSFSASNGKVYEFFAMKQEQLDELLNVIESTDKIYENNEKIFNIVSKHAAAYYAGDKTLDETVKFIQSEANIYINEQR